MSWRHAPRRPMPRRIDACNGDADGLCAVRQWRLAHPARAELVTGLKRDIELLERVRAGAGDELLVCDVSMLRNRAALLRLLGAGVRVTYFDHHAAGRVPRHAGLRACLDFAPDVCTSLLVDRQLRGRYRAWALAGAYGDGLGERADALAAASGFDPAQRAALRRLGEAVNYNAYGDSEADVLIAPRLLYRVLAAYRDPLRLCAEQDLIDRIDRQRRDDLERARACGLAGAGADGRVRVLPDAPWSRRVLGTLANALAAEDPGRAHAVLRHTAAGGLLVSVRAPRLAGCGAHELCARFGGGGRAGAAGIEHLPPGRLDEFVAAFTSHAWRAAPR